MSLLTSPLFHVSGCHSGLVVGMMAGIRLVILAGRFTPEAAFDAIERERVMIWATVPTMIWRACEHPDRHDRDLRSIIAVSFGGSPSADELQRRIRETFPNVKATTNAYGLTESSSVATALAGDDALRKPDSVGLPVPNTQIAIAGGVESMTMVPMRLWAKLSGGATKRARIATCPFNFPDKIRPTSMIRSSLLPVTSR